MTEESAPLSEVERFETPTGDIITLLSNGVRWQVACSSADGTHVWTETDAAPGRPFTEDDARTEFARWSV